MARKGKASGGATAQASSPAVVAPQLQRLLVPIDSLQHDPNNARVHGEKNMRAIQQSLQAFGQLKPIVVQREGMTIRAGNGTVMAARALGWTQIAAVVVDVDDATATQFAIADNRSGELAVWDDEVLARLLQGMDEASRRLVTFEASDLRKLLKGLELADDEIPAAPAEPVTREGDLIELGVHRLLCGDCTVAENVTRLLGDVVPFLMVTDPPYGVSYDAGWRQEGGLRRSKRRVGKVTNDDTSRWAAAWALFAGAVAYVWHDALAAGDVAHDLRSVGLEVRCQIVWHKNRPVIGRGNYHWRHEPCWYAVRKGESAKWAGDRSQETVWSIGMGKQAGNDTETNHSTQKPLECMARPIRNHGDAGDAVYDPFLGSGTTLIACEQLGRQCFGLEIDPGYCDVIVARWEKLTGQKAVRPVREKARPSKRAGAAAP